MKRERAVGFEPVYDGESKLLILGSFPSVKSREVAFYYGNRQNRFWRTVCSFFGEEIPQTVAEKINFLRRRRIALWDVIVECEIEGSSDASISGEVVADIPRLLQKSNVQAIFCNGKKSFALLEQSFPEAARSARCLSSTSPANPRFSKEEWHTALSEVFQGERV